MACYLSFSEIERECQGCSHEIPPGLVGWTDELLPGRLLAVCKHCLDGLDHRLRGVQKIVTAGKLIRPVA